MEALEEDAPGSTTHQVRVLVRQCDSALSPATLPSETRKVSLPFTFLPAVLLVSNVLFHPGGECVVQRLQGALEGGIHHAPFPDHPSAIQGPDEGAIIVVVADFDPAMGRDPLRQVRERLVYRPGHGLFSLRVVNFVRYRC